MRLSTVLVLYTALVLGANTAFGQGGNLADMAELRTGDMAKLVPTDPPAPLPEAMLLDAEDAEHALSSKGGKLTLINFWATWCAPCRAELATLDQLQETIGSEDFQVLTIATGPNPVPAITRLFEEEGIEHLPILRDPRQGLARQMGVLALPVTVLVDAEGREIGRLLGEAAWDGPEALALIRAFAAPAQP